MKGLFIYLIGSTLYAASPYPFFPVSVAAASNATCAFGSVVTGQLLVVGESHFTGVATVSDTLSTSYTLAGNVTASGLTTNIWVGLAPSSGSNTLTLAGAILFTNLACGVFSGITATLDGAAVTGGWSGSPPTVTTSAITTTVGQDLLLAYFGGNHVAATLNPVLPWVSLGSVHGGDGGGFQFLSAGASGSYTAVATNGTNDDGAYVLVALKSTSSLTVATTSLPPLAIGSAYSYTLNATGGVGAYTWSKSGSLPIGMSLSSGGVLSGTPSSGGGTVSFIVTDGSSNTANKSLSVRVAPNYDTPAYVQSATGGTANITQVAFGSPVTSGHVILVSIVASRNAGSGGWCATPTDTLGTVYTPIYYSGVLVDTSFALCVYSGVAPSTGSDTVFMRQPGSAFEVLAYVIEFSGTDPNGDVFAVGAGVGGGNANTASLTSIVPSNMYAVAAGYRLASVINIQSPFTASEGVGATMADGYIANKSSGSQAASFTQSGNDLNWLSFIVSLRPSISSLVTNAGSHAFIM